MKEVFSEQDVLSTFRHFATSNSDTITIDDLSSHMSRKGEDGSRSSAVKMMSNANKVKRFTPEDVNVRSIYFII